VRRRAGLAAEAIAPLWRRSAVLSICCRAELLSCRAGLAAEPLSGPSPPVIVAETGGNRPFRWSGRYPFARLGPNICSKTRRFDLESVGGPWYQFFAQRFDRTSVRSRHDKRPEPCQTLEVIVSVAAELEHDASAPSVARRRSRAGRPGRPVSGPRSASVLAFHGSRPRRDRPALPPARRLDPARPQRLSAPELDDSREILASASAWSDATTVDLRSRPMWPAAAVPSAQTRPRTLVAAPPRLRAEAAPLRMTRRGVAVLAGVVLAAVIALLAVAAASSPSQQPAPAANSVPAVITVQAGDTLWSIANEVAPQRDPRNVVYDLRKLNNLSSVDLVPGQQIRTR
jgi:LysM repeat protein